MFTYLDHLAVDEFLVEEGYDGIGNYVAGGFCPIHLGDRLDNSTYTIVHKLRS